MATRNNKTIYIVLAVAAAALFFFRKKLFPAGLVSALSSAANPTSTFNNYGAFTIPEYDNSYMYEVPGMKVKYQGNIYESRVRTQGNPPDWSITQWKLLST